MCIDISLPYILWNKTDLKVMTPTSVMTEILLFVGKWCWGLYSIFHHTCEIFHNYQETLWKVCGIVNFIDNCDQQSLTFTNNGDSKVYLFIDKIMYISLCPLFHNVNITSNSIIHSFRISYTISTFNWVLIVQILYFSGVIDFVYFHLFPCQNTNYYT